MKIEVLKDRIQKAEEKVLKKNGTVAKKQKALEKKQAYLRDTYKINPDTFNMFDRTGFTHEAGEDIYWTMCDIGTLKDDLQRLAKEIAETEKTLEGYRKSLQTETEKAESRNVPAILEFLQAWKKNMHDFYMVGLTEYFRCKAEKDAVYAEIRALGWDADTKALDAKYTELSDALHSRVNGYYERVKYTDTFGKPRWKEVKTASGDLEYIKPYNSCRTLEEAEECLNKDLTEEANRKYDFIIVRVNDICGKITDATGLMVKAGELNGIIIGEKGTAKVNTIGAGGYNIQCFHFRTLIHRVKE